MTLESDAYMRHHAGPHRSRGTAMTDRVWCTFRCLVQAVYREVRHIGPPGDGGARCRGNGEYAAAAARCSVNRALLQGLALWQRGRAATRVSEVPQPYLAATMLAPEDLPAVFRLPSWSPSYGGERWAIIAEALLDLRAALSAGDAEAAERLCDRIGELRHNSARLDLTTDAERATWRASSWQRAKWPALCVEQRDTG